MALSMGVRLGPYEIAELLGAGGMGAVYRARDPRLGRDVAIKVLPDDIATDPDRLRRFEQEAKAVAALNHPHILTVHDVGTHDGTPYVVTELLEGETLREVLKRRTPTQRQVLTWSVQIAQGLAAAHRKHIVHRDLKPENLFLTTEGRVKILDFGLAKLASAGVDSQELTASHPTRPGVVMGTVAYMSPEQVQARPVDARSDLFSFGVVLYELLARKHPFRRETVAATLTAILQETPPELTSVDRGIPPVVDGIVKRCLEKRREERFSAGHDLALALEAVLQAPTGSSVLQDVAERSPYPGLSSFTEKDASVFFGREAEVKALWERIRSRRLLAVVGPSGVGKSSFLRAGVIAARPEGWATIVATPGPSALRGLGQAILPALAGDMEALQRILSIEDPQVAFDLVSRWRRTHAEALLVFDQFEELFTLNPPELQARFSTLLGRLAGEADVHVVLSLRDDFLIRCHEQPALAHVFEHLTPLLAVSGDGLRRALVVPAKSRGYRFEEVALVDEMVSTVEGVRGALPLLAFAVARLWEKRDRDRKTLTCDAYREIGGVEGALAQHAEATMDKIGPVRPSVVRDIFRNLVTAQGTRAVIDREDLLSAFPDRAVAEDVLRQLVDGRLLTTYEVEGKEGEPSHHRVEVVHESLLKAWPRLVRWQAQDEEGAVLRDQLRQAAHLWEEKGRTNDLLWTGTAYREYELWHERYAGALTALEEDFARSMAHRARRKKRLVRLGAAAAFVAVSAVAVAITLSRQQAVEAARRSESSRLVALAELRLAEDPTEALALATASLELADTREARVFALRALAEGPPALELLGSDISMRVPAFSPDGRWLAAAGHTSEVGVWSDDGQGPLVLSGHERSSRASNVAAWVSNNLLATGLGSGIGKQVHLWSLPEGTRIRTIDFGRPSSWRVASQRLLAETPDSGSAQQPGTGRLRSWVLPDGEATVLSRVDWRAPGARWSFFTPDASSWLYVRQGSLYSRPLPASARADRLVARLGADPSSMTEVDQDRLVVADRGGGIRLLSFAAGLQPEVQTITRPDTAPFDVLPNPLPDPTGRWLTEAEENHHIRLWDLAAWPAAQPWVLRRSGTWYGTVSRFHPKGDWLVASTANFSRVTFWPLRRALPSVTAGYAALVRPVAFSRDSRWLATSWGDLGLRLWPLTADEPARVRRLDVPEQTRWTAVAFSPTGGYLFGVGMSDRAWAVPLDGSPSRRLRVFSEDDFLYAGAISPSGRFVATASGFGGGPRTLRVWDVETGEMRLFDLPEAQMPPGRDSPTKRPLDGVTSLAFADEATLYTAGGAGLHRWNLATGSREVRVTTRTGYSMTAAFSAGARVAITLEQRGAACSRAVARDLTTGTSRDLPEFGDCVAWGMAALDPSGSVAATGSLDGVVRVGRLSATAPHLLLGHKGAVAGIAISPDLRWVATSGEDNTLRLWPMPDLDKPPQHTLPHDALVAKLKSLTNLRALKDPLSASGWKIEVGPFPGWKDIPAW